MVEDFDERDLENWDRNHTDHLIIPVMISKIKDLIYELKDVKEELNELNKRCLTNDD